MAIAGVWRQKQSECTFGLTAMEGYEDVQQVTRTALDDAGAAARPDLEPGQKDALIA